ncbi:MAG TPA: hypothetical protein VH796_00860 [Nitrososphaeraceae archaeon]|jgi:hypothetical protein
MRNQKSEYTLSLTQRAYLISKSLRAASYWLLALTISILFLSGLAFVTYNISFTRDVLNIITRISLLLIILIALYIVGWFVVKAKHEYNRIKEWNEDYLHSSYTLIFDTTIPKGNTTGEQILSLAKLVFPELRDDFATSIWDEPNANAFISTLLRRIFRQNNKSKIDDRIPKKDYETNSYKLDLVQKTKVGYLIIKDFGDTTTVSLEDIERLLKVCDKLRIGSRRIFRVICVAKNYDENFLQRESLEDIMIKNIKSDLKTDLLIKESNGYSVLWVS